MTATADDCARELLELVPAIMRHLRAEMRRQRGAGLSVPQFRALAFLNRQPGASLSALAEHIGLTRPSMSHTVEGLVTRKLVTRRTSTADRRSVTLDLTGRGRALLDAARATTQAHLAEQLSDLSVADRTRVIETARVLRPIFAAGASPQDGPER